MAIYYYPNSAKTITTAPYSTATNDIVVTNLSALYKLNKTIGLVWSSYTPSSADRGLTLPYIPGTTANQAPVAPSLITSVLAPTQTITQYQASSFTPVSVYGGSAVATSYSSLGTFVGYNVTISPSLPTGLNFSTSFGTQSILNSANATYYLYNTASVIISGTPTTPAAAQTYTITFTDSSGQTANASFVLTIVAGSAPLSVTGLVTTTQAYTQGVPISSLPTVSTQGGTGPLNYAISPTLPTGLTLSTTTGIVSGTPTVSSNLTSYTVTVTDRSTPAQQGTTSFSISVAANPPTSVLSIPTQTIIQGVNFTPFAPVAGSGGTAPLSYKITPSLPAGLVFTTSTGVISGPATAAQAATNYTVTVVDSLNQTSAQTFNLTVNALTPLTAIQTQPSYNLYNATPISFTPIRSNGGYGTVSFALAPTLPSGLTYNTTNGLVSGTPTSTSTTATYTVTLSDQGGQTASGTFTLQVGNIPVSASTQVPSTIVYRSVAINTFIPVTATGGYTPYSYSINPSLPSGLFFSTSSAYVTGTATTSSAATNYVVTVRDNLLQTSTASFSLTVLNPAAISVVQSVSNLTLTKGVASSSFIPVSGSGGYGGLTYAISPALPAGLSFDTTIGQISGTPTAYLITATSFTVTVSDQAAQTASGSFNLTVLAPAFSVSLAVPTTNLTKNVAATTFIPVTAAGGALPYSYSISPALPSGLTFNTGTGVISGTPTVANTSNYTVTVTDLVNNTGSKTFAISVSNPAPITVTTVITATSLVKSVSNANFTPVTAAGGYGSIVLSVNPNLPAGLSFATNGQITGTPTQVSTQTAYQVVAVDSLSQVASSYFYITVTNPLLTSTSVISVATLTEYTAVTPFTPVTYVGGTPPVTYSISPNLVTGLTLNSSSGILSGTPTASIGPTNYTITITDTNLSTTSQTLNLQVTPPPVLVSSISTSSISGYAGSYLSPIAPISASGGYGSYSYGISPSLPTGLTFNSVNGQINGTPSTTSTTATYTVTINDTVSQSTSSNFKLVIYPQAVVATNAVPSSTLLVYQLANPFTPVTGSGGYGTLSYSLSTSLPTGLSFNTGTGQITGTPTAISNTATYSVTVADSINQRSTGSFSLSVYQNAPPPFSVTVSSVNVNLTQNQISSFSPVQVLGGVSPYSYIITPVLPDGLSYSSSTGVISGIPTTVSSSSTFNVTVTDSQPQSITKTFNLTVQTSNLAATGNQQINTNNAASTSTTTGALVVAGGAGIGGNLNVGGTITAGGSQVLTTSGNYVTSITAGTDTAVSTTTGAVTVWNTSTLQSITGRGNSTTNSISILNTATAVGTASGALIVAGGVGIGGNLNIAGGALVYGQTTFNGSVTFNGTSTYVFSTNTVYTDNIIELHAPSGGVPGVWNSSDGKDIGLRFHYYNKTISSDANAALVLADDSQFLEFYNLGAENPAGTVFTGTNYGTFKTGNIVLASTATSSNTSTGALTVAGGVGIGGVVNIANTSYIAGAQIITTATIGNYAAGGVITGTTATFVITNTTSVYSTNTGALRVAGGAGIGGGLYVGGAVTATNFYTAGGLQVDSKATLTNVVITGTGAATSTSSGALTVAGGVGVGGDLYVGGAITATSLTLVNGLIPTQGTNIDQILTTSTYLTLNRAWQNIGITGTTLVTGSYIVQTLVNDNSSGGGQVNTYYSGIMSWYSGATTENGYDEIVLSRAGASNGTGSIYLQVSRSVGGYSSLQISGNTNNSTSSLYTFNFRRMI